MIRAAPSAPLAVIGEASIFSLALFDRAQCVEKTSSATSLRLLSPPFDVIDDLIQRHIGEKSRSLLGVVTVAQGELLQKAHRIRHAQFFVEQAKGLLIYFRQRFCFRDRFSIFLIRSIGSTTLTDRSFTFLAFRSRSSSHVQK